MTHAFGYHIEPMARSSDPVTSFEAADQARDMAKHHQLAIVTALKTFGPMGKCAIARHLSGVDHIAVARRMKELERLNLVRETGEVTKSDSGRNERVWEAT